MVMLVDENTKKIADEVLGLTKAGITEVWDKIQQAAPELWKLVVRQKMIDGLECAIAAGLCLVALGVAIWGVRKLAKNDPDSDAAIALAIFGCGGAVVGFVVTLFAAIDFLGNPAYWALRDILEMVRH